MSEEKKIEVEVIKPYAFAHRGCDVEYFKEAGEVREVTEECAKRGICDGAFKPIIARVSEASPASAKQAQGPKANKMKKPAENK